jgi:hypothetical protein
VVLIESFMGYNEGVETKKPLWSDKGPFFTPYALDEKPATPARVFIAGRGL